MVSTLTSKACRQAPFATESESVGAMIIKDLEGRCGAVKLAEGDDCIVLTAEALSLYPEHN